MLQPEQLGPFEDSKKQELKKSILEKIDMIVGNQHPWEARFSRKINVSSAAISKWKDRPFPKAANDIEDRAEISVYSIAESEKERDHLKGKNFIQHELYLSVDSSTVEGFYIYPLQIMSNGEMYIEANRSVTGNKRNQRSVRRVVRNSDMEMFNHLLEIAVKRMTSQATPGSK